MGINKIVKLAVILFVGEGKTENTTNVHFGLIFCGHCFGAGPDT